MHKIILFVEPSDEDFVLPIEIGDLFMNRFAIEEEDMFEILKIFELGETYREITLDWDMEPFKTDYENFAKERHQKGKDYFISDYEI